MGSPPPVELAEWFAEQERRPREIAAQCHAEIAAALGSLTGRLAASVCDRRTASENPEAASYRQRLWTCLEYHWKRFAADGPIGYSVVVRRCEKGDLAYGKVGGNVLAEVVLAQALELKEEKAAEMFETYYMPSVRAVACRLGGETAIDLVSNFAAELILAREGRPPRIATFQGKTPLASWLRAVVVNCWVSHTRRRGLKTCEELPEPCRGEDPAGRADETECEALLRPVFSAAVDSLPAADRLLLKILVLDGAPQHQVAHSLGLNSGTVTRRRQRAAQNVFCRVQQIRDQSQQAHRMDECLRLLLTGDDPELRRCLGTVLARGLDDDDRGHGRR